MKSTCKVLIAAAFTAGLLVPATPTFAADPEELRLTWRSLGNVNVEGCLERARKAMKDQKLNDVETKDGELVQGRTGKSVAKIMCVRHEGETLAVIAVSSSSQSDARELRDGLRNRIRR